MTTETVLDNRILVELRSRSVISEKEVVISSGDLYFAKNVLTNERRMIDSAMITSINTNESINETSKRLLKG
jgi:hypothetical protein